LKKQEKAKYLLEVISKIMPEQDYQATQMNIADVVLDNAIKANQDAPIILMPCKQALHFPTPTITA